MADAERDRDADGFFLPGRPAGGFAVLAAMGDSPALSGPFFGFGAALARGFAAGAAAGFGLG